MRRYHQWEVVGREYDTPVVNMWRCKACGIYRSAGFITKEGCQVMEFSAPDGTVLSRGRKAGPSCTGGSRRKE